MDSDKIPEQASYWQMDRHVKRKPGIPRKNWIDTMRQDLKTIDMAREKEAEESAADRKDWPNVSKTRDDLNLSK